MKNAETETQKWIRTNGMNVASFNTTHIKLLKAQHLANQLLNEHKSLLTSTQIQTLNHFLKQMNIKKIRQKLKPETAYPILNIGTKIKRQLHRQNL
jgi:hypothetical protein